MRGRRRPGYGVRLGSNPARRGRGAAGRAIAELELRQEGVPPTWRTAGPPPPPPAPAAPRGSARGPSLASGTEHPRRAQRPLPPPRALVSLSPVGCTRVRCGAEAGPWSPLSRAEPNRAEPNRAEPQASRQPAALAMARASSRPTASPTNRCPPPCPHASVACPDLQGGRQTQTAAIPEYVK